MLSIKGQKDKNKKIIKQPFAKLTLVKLESSGSFPSTVIHFYFTNFRTATTPKNKQNNKPRIKYLKCFKRSD